MKTNSNILIKIILFVSIALILLSCELIVIGKKPGEIKPLEYDRHSPIGSVVVFKTELDSNNISAASDIIATKDGKYLLAIDRYENEYELERVRRVISKRKITKIKQDTLSEHNIKIILELDYYKYISFNTSLIDGLWYITNYNGI